MAHNISRRRAARDVLEMPLGHFAGCPSVLSSTCSRCGWVGELRLSDLAARWGAAVLLAALLPRLRCRCCGKPPGAVAVRVHSGASAGVALSGPGSF